MDLTYVPPSALRRRSTAAETYVAVFAVCLGGYALMGRPFAYLGVPPLFVGEIMLAAGLFVAVRAGRLRETFASATMQLWAVLLVWTLARTVTEVGEYALDAVRDAMMVVYGLYAVVVASILLADPERLRELAVKYRTLVVVFLSVAWAVYGISKAFSPMLPTLPWTGDVEIITAKGGDMMVHMTGIVAYLMMGGLRSNVAALGMASLSSVLIMVSNRGGMVAFMLGLGLVWLLRPRGRGTARVAFAFVAFVVVGLLVAPLVTVQIQGGSRDLSVEQVVENVKSIFVSTDSGALDGTKRWRLLWWTEIVDYTFGGPYFWTGKGFGVNLAESDGFTLDGNDNLRSPHNGHLTVLARAGVPGFVLWLALQGAWFVGVLGAWWQARLRDQRRWMALFAWLAAVWLAILVNASFDVYLEGPMGAIWYWTVVGVGVAAVRIRRTHPQLLDPLDLPFPPTHGGPDSAPTPRPYAWS